MRIGIDARYVQDQFPGIGRYTYNLARALAHIGGGNTVIIVCNSRMTNTRYDLSQLSSPGIQLKEVVIPTLSLWEQLRLPRVIKGLGLDVFHSPYYIKPYRLPCPGVVTIYDAIPSHFPQHLPSVWSRIIYNVTMRLALGSSEVVIATSEATKRDIIHFFGVSADKITVIPLAADEFTEVTGGDEKGGSSAITPAQPYILYVGINKPHKNLVRLIQAYDRSKASHRLVIAGKEDPRYTEPRQAVAELGLGDRVTIMGEVSDEVLSRLYAAAELFVFPSLAEGFGLPPLEAMSHGTATIASNIPALVEVIGGGSLLVDPLDVDGMAEAIRKVLGDNDFRSQLREKALAHSRLFSWRRTAEESIAAYRKATTSDR